MPEKCFTAFTVSFAIIFLCFVSESNAQNSTNSTTTVSPTILPTPTTPPTIRPTPTPAVTIAPTTTTAPPPPPTAPPLPPIPNVLIVYYNARAFINDTVLYFTQDTISLYASHLNVTEALGPQVTTSYQWVINDVVLPRTDRNITIGPFVDGYVAKALLRVIPSGTAVVGPGTANATIFVIKSPYDFHLTSTTNFAATPVSALTKVSFTCAAEKELEQYKYVFTKRSTLTEDPAVLMTSSGKSVTITVPYVNTTTTLLLQCFGETKTGLRTNLSEPLSVKINYVAVTIESINSTVDGIKPLSASPTTEERETFAQDITSVTGALGGVPTGPQSDAVAKKILDKISAAVGILSSGGNVTAMTSSEKEIYSTAVRDCVMKLVAPVPASTFTSVLSVLERCTLTPITSIGSVSILKAVDVLLSLTPKKHSKSFRTVAATVSDSLNRTSYGLRAAFKAVYGYLYSDPNTLLGTSTTFSGATFTARGVYDMEMNFPFTQIRAMRKSAAVLVGALFTFPTPPLSLADGTTASSVFAYAEASSGGYIETDTAIDLASNASLAYTYDVASGTDYVQCLGAGTAVASCAKRVTSAPPVYYLVRVPPPTSPPTTLPPTTTTAPPTSIVKLNTTAPGTSSDDVPLIVGLVVGLGVPCLCLAAVGIWYVHRQRENAGQGVVCTDVSGQTQQQPQVVSSNASVPALQLSPHQGSGANGGGANPLENTPRKTGDPYTV